MDEEEYQKWLDSKRGKKSHAANSMKNVELPKELLETKNISKSIKDGIQDAIKTIEKTYGFVFPEIEYTPYTKNEKAPFTYYPYQVNGEYKAKLNINTLFDWNDTIEEFNDRIYNKNYKKHILSSQNMTDLLLHEVAHFKTFEDCKTWGEYVRKEEDVRKRFLPGISAYNNHSIDGAETIAEGFVAKHNGDDVPKKIEELIKEYVQW